MKEVRLKRNWGWIIGLIIIPNKILS